MSNPKLIRITTVPLSLEKLLEGQLEYIQNYFSVIAISADKEKLKALGAKNSYATYHIEMTRKITPLSDLKAVYKLYKYLKKEKPAIVHTHTPKAGIVGMFASWLAGVPNRLHTVAGLPLMEASGNKRTLLDFVEKLTYKFATKVYPNSKGLFDFIVAQNLTKRGKLKIIGQGSSNGINTQHFNPSLFESTRNTLRKELNILPDSMVYIFVGRLVGDKGINELVVAFKELETKNHDSSTLVPNSDSPVSSPQSLVPNPKPLVSSKVPKLLLVGPLESDLDPLKEETLKEITANPNIISVGFQKDVRPFFALVFPSYREGFPNVVMQAGAMELPSIVSDINGCNEIIIEGENGSIIPVKNTVAVR